MIDLLNKELRSRDIRKLVEPNLYKVSWDLGVDKTSEWVMASFEDVTHTQKIRSWLNSKDVSDSTKAIVTDTAWSELQQITWGTLCNNPKHYFSQEHILVVSADRSWILEYAPQQILRFGRWKNET